MPKIKLLPKQSEAYKYLLDKTTTEILYGGSAGGGKSYLGSLWLVTSALQYANTRYLLGRAKLKDVKQSTLLTVFDLCKTIGLIRETHYTYNGQEGILSFYTGSQIFLIDLYQYPTDPEFESLGSREYTGAFVDEASQITHKAKNILTSRIRYKLNEYNLVPKLFIGTNPTKNFLYTEFHQKWREGTLPAYRKYVPALPEDNPFLPEEYIQSLRRLDEVSKQRLLYGNWEYDSDDTNLFDFRALQDMITNQWGASGTKYLSVDVARFGSDSSVYCVWDGLYIEKIVMQKTSATTVVETTIKNLAQTYKIPRSRIVVDQDNMGGGVVDHLSGVYAFINGSSQIKERFPTKYQNLKTQCYAKLAELVNAHKIGMSESIPQEIKQKLVQELEQVKRIDIDKDESFKITKKEHIKDAIGRSPDIADSVMMRMVFELRPTSAIAVNPF